MGRWQEYLLLNNWPWFGHCLGPQPGVSLLLPNEGNVVFTAMFFRAATNVRTFEYYSFEIFTNELFLRTNVRWLAPVGLFLAHTLRSGASASRVGAMDAWRYS